MSSDLLKDGKPQFGLYTGEIKNTDITEYAKVPKFLRKFRAKKWYFIGFYTKEVVLGVAVVDVGLIGKSFAYAFDMKDKQLYEFVCDSPLAMASNVTDNLENGESTFNKGKNSVSIKTGLPDNKCSVKLDADTPFGRLIIDASFDESREAVIPHQVLLPTPKDNFSFTHKAAGMPATGFASIGDKKFELKEGESFAIVDYTAGYLDNFWEWRWASFGCLSEEGNRIGLNLVEPIHHHTIHENAIWIDGERIPTSQATFTRNRDNFLEPWTVKTDDGIVDLVFTPYGERKEDFNLLIVKSWFHQPIGTFSGTITAPDGRKFELKEISGVVEDHEAKW